METFSIGTLQFIILLIVSFKSCLLQSTNLTASWGNGCKVKIGCNSVMVTKPECGRGELKLGQTKYLVVLQLSGCLGRKHRKDISVLWSRVVGNTTVYLSRCRQRYACTVLLPPIERKKYVFLIQLTYGTRQHKLLTVTLKKPDLKKNVKRNIPKYESDELIEHFENSSTHSATGPVLLSSREKSNTQHSDSEAVSHKYRTLINLLSEISNPEEGEENLKQTDGKNSPEDLVVFKELHHKPVHSLKYNIEKIEHGNRSGSSHIIGELHTSKHFKMLNLKPNEYGDVDALLDHLNKAHEEEVSKASPGGNVKQKHFPVLSDGGPALGKSHLGYNLGVVKKAHISHSSVKALDDAMMTNSLILKAEDQVNAQILKLENDLMQTDTQLDSLKLSEAKSLQGIKASINELVRMISRAQAENKLKATQLIEESTEATVSSIQKLCLHGAGTVASAPGWAAWNAWEDCSMSCGTGGYMFRRRSCKSPGGKLCIGNNFDIKQCLQSICPATWVTWGHWSHCSATCGTGLMVRTRPCRTTEVQVHCMGATAQVMDCFHQPCPTASASTTSKPHSSNGRRDTNLSVHNVPVTGVWGPWSAWSVCQQCGRNTRHRRRMCINARGQSIPEGGPCLGVNTERSDCDVSLCPFAKRYPNASRVSEAGSVKLKCHYSGSLVPRQVYWITPRDQHIQRHSNDHRIHILGTSLVVEAARYVDQGKYRCVLLLPKNEHKIIEAPLVVETCRDKSCHNDGKCRIYVDPEYVNFKHYKCKCTASHIGTFCEDSAFMKSSQKYIIIIIIIVIILICLGLILFFFKRSRNKSHEHHEESWLSKKFHNVVGKDDSFVEISEYDYVDFDGLDKTGNDKRHPKGYTTAGSDGYDGSFLKYPSPRAGGSHDEDPDHYHSMGGKGQEQHYENMSRDQPHYENEESLGLTAHQLAQDCIDGLDEAKMSWTSLDEPSSNSIFKKKKVRIALPSFKLGVGVSSEHHATKSLSRKVRPTKQTEYHFPKSITIKNKDQEKNFGKHFNRSYISDVDIPTVSTPKTESPILSRGIIYPSDIVGPENKKKGFLPSLGMNVPFFNSNQNNGRERHELIVPPESEAMDSVYRTPQTPPRRYRRDTITPLDTSTPLKAMPDLDDTGCFSGVSVSVRYKDRGPDTDEASEQSVCLSDHRYTPNTSEPEQDDASGSEYNMMLRCDVDHTQDNDF